MVGEQEQQHEINGHSLLCLVHKGQPFIQFITPLSCCVLCACVVEWGLTGKWVNWVNKVCAHHIHGDYVRAKWGLRNGSLRAEWGLGGACVKLM